MDAAVTTIYIELLEEGTQVWRPVQAALEYGYVYRLPQTLAQEMTGEVWAFPPGSLVHCEMRDFDDGPGLVAMRRANATDLQAVADTLNIRSGIDLLIAGRPATDAIVGALVTVAGLTPDAIKLPDDGEDKRLALFDHPVWAVVYAFETGDFGFKIDLDGVAPRDYVAIARKLAEALNVAIAWPDETTRAATAFTMCHRDGGGEYPVVIDDGHQIPSFKLTNRFAIGDRVVKNPAMWKPNAFDDWGRGEGVGVVVEPPFHMNDDEVDVRWPHGRCFESTGQLLLAPLNK
jgi:hypothetical protein